MTRKRTRRTAARAFEQRDAIGRLGKGRLAMLVYYQTSAPPSPVDLARHLDREWFRSHSHRSHRLRRAVTGEFPEGSTDTWVVVRQLEPGVRQRLPFNALVQLPSGEAPEHVAHAMYDLIAEARGRTVFGYEIIHRSRMYEIAGDREDPSQDTALRRH